MTPEQCTDIRNKLGLTQTEMAVKAGVSPNIVIFMESGRLNPNCQGRIRRSLAAAYGIEPDQIPTRESTKVAS